MPTVSGGSVKHDNCVILHSTVMAFPHVTLLSNVLVSASGWAFKIEIHSAVPKKMGKTMSVSPSSTIAWNVLLGMA
jgi:hypothetical protein